MTRPALTTPIRPNPPVQMLMRGDCTRLPLDTLPYYDHVITDPPYSPRVHANVSTNRKSAGEVPVAVTAKAGPPRRAQARLKANDLKFTPLSGTLQEYISLAVRRAPLWSAVYTDHEGTFAWELCLGRRGDADARGLGTVRTVPVLADYTADGLLPVMGETDGGVVGGFPWIRWSMPQITGDRPPQGMEYLITHHGPGRMYYGGPGGLMALMDKCLRGHDKHGAEKPLVQALKLIAWFTRPGAVVFDPCAGRGTLGVACALLGRSYIGIDDDQTGFLADGQARLAAAARGGLSDSDTKHVRLFCEDQAYHLGMPYCSPLAAQGPQLGPVDFHHGCPVDPALADAAAIARETSKDYKRRGVTPPTPAEDADDSTYAQQNY